MRRRKLVSLIVALGAGIAAAMIVFTLVSKEAPSIVTAEKTVKVVVMARSHRPGVKLTEKDVTTKDWPERLLPSGHIRNEKEAIARVILKDVSKDEPLLRDKLAPEGSQEGLSNRIPEGFRAFSVKITDEIGVSGYILPGSRVDVLTTVQVEDSTKKQRRPSSVTKTILQNVMVLAVGAEKESTQEKTQIKATTVTLALTPDQGEKLTLATTRGSIRLSLRNQRFDDQVVSKSISLADLISSTNSAQVRLEVPKEETVQILVLKRRLSRGAKLTEDDIELKEWPARLASSEYVRDPKDALGRILAVSVVSGEPLLQGKIASGDVAQGLSGIIPAGRRAFAVKVDEVTGVSGFLLPKSKVDVIVTVEMDKAALRKSKEKKLSSLSAMGGDKVSLTVTILQDVEVLAAGSKTDVDQERGRIETKVVTLLLTPEQGQILTLASTKGRIHLAMRNPLDKKPIESSVVSMNDLLSVPQDLPPPPPHTVEILLDGKRSKVEFLESKP